VRFQSVVPENKLVNRIEKIEFLFEQSEPVFNFSVCLRLFHPCDDVIDFVLVEEILEHMRGEITVPCRNELGIVVGQDIARGSVLTESLVQNGDCTLCWRIKHPVAGNQPEESSIKDNNPFFRSLESNSFQFDNQLMHQHHRIDGIVRNGESVMRIYDLFKNNRSGFVDLIRVEDDQFELRIQEFFLRPGSFSSGMTPVFWYCCFN
jgi:hypothetical protein